MTEGLEEAREVLHAIEAKGLTWAAACFGTATILNAIRNQERQRIREALEPHIDALREWERNKDLPEAVLWDRLGYLSAELSALDTLEDSDG